MDLTGQAVIVTGSSSGIGEAIARRCAAAGAGVLINSATSVDAGEAVAESLDDALYVQGDISDPETGPHLVSAALERWGRLDGLVNNAGRTCEVPLTDLEALTPEHWHRVFDTNVIGTFFMTQAALALLREADDGWVISITSIAGIRQTGSSLPYAVSKAALDHLTTHLAKHVGDKVRINAVAPGLVATPWTETWEGLKAGVTALAPLGRVATPEDIADACEGLIMSRYTTGQTLLVDGGLGLVL
ncbi:MAG TPA: SDR family oxidoreductase [Acidimicrobiales bacterium]|nr:SDR family oxidoreductase [Acidimicrobiales bacterium]